MAKLNLGWLPALMGAGALALASCTGGFSALGQGKSPDPSETATGAAPETNAASDSISGGISLDEEAPQPTQRPATPAPDPTPTSTAGSQTGPFALAAEVSPATAEIWARPPDGLAPTVGPAEVQLTATVTMTTGFKTSLVSWKTANPDIATVDSLGLVRAAQKGGRTLVTATANFRTPEGFEATAGCLVTVSASGGVDFVVE